MATLQQQKIRIRLQAFDRRLLDTSCEKIVDTATGLMPQLWAQFLYQPSAEFIASCDRLT
jgi:hypothetical protein